ncbi:gliding motility lipoprotein GldB [Fulvivirgaceae bacterium BMA12]|uniref:Gliding motility lipoprotein GldB n=1 Tax=Agaribacillus aureus TaxID=3051825 RepID=A0ABT8LF15_9BACT|nr:gliding motility lipoprotein GldB [Fulvivirgaceae bacterium BMA12]
MRGIYWLVELTLLATILLISSCGDKPCGEDIDIQNIDVNVEIERLEDEFFELTTAEEAITFLDENPVLSEAFYQRSQFPNDSILVNKLLSLAGSPYLDTMRREVDTLFGELTDIRASFEGAFRRIKYYYPEFQPPEIKTIITGLGDGSDLYISPELIIIGLDWFLGEAGSYAPNNIPQYIKQRLTKDYLVPSCIMFLSDPFNATALEDKTMLAEMLYFGKAYAFTKEMMPCISDSLILGYSGQQIKEINFNQERIWGHFVDESLLYETNHFVKVKYLNERPNVPEIGDKCPGRIARWLGWQVIQNYRKKSDIGFVDLMKEVDAGEIFRQSKYRPTPH